MGKKLELFLKHYHLAQQSLENSNITLFMENIGYSKVYAHKYPDCLAKVSFLKVQGLYNLHQYEKALESIPEALKYNSDDDVLLRNIEGQIYSSLGRFHQARTIFEHLIPRITDQELLFKIYDNLIQVYISLYKESKDTLEMNKIKEYLTIVESKLTLLSEENKGLFYNNCGIYYCYIRDYEKSIDYLNKALNCSTEEQRATLYNNLAEALLNAIEDGYSDLMHDYLDKAETLGIKYNNYGEVGRSSYIRARDELRNDQIFKATDSLYIALEHFKKAKEYSMAVECLQKINKILGEYATDEIKYFGEFAHQA